MNEMAAWIAMTTLPEEARRWTDGLWLVLCAVWLVGMFMTRQTVRRQTGASRIFYMGLVLLGAWLLFRGRSGIAWMDGAVFPVTPVIAIAGLVTALAGIAFAIWARLILGANWSGTITIKQGHTLVRRGPYRIVRHPIYTGLLVAWAGTSLTIGTVRSILSLPLLAFAFWLKTRMEERFMVEEFGDDYLRYSHEVRALIPFVF